MLIPSFAPRDKSKPLSDFQTTRAKPSFACTALVLFVCAILTASVASAEPQTGDCIFRVEQCKAARNLVQFSPIPSVNFLAESSNDPMPHTNEFSFRVLRTQFSADVPNAQINVTTNANPKLSLAEHGFWDRQNGLLFAAIGASRALDYSSTLNFRQRGRDEALLTNDIVDNHPAFAAIEVAGTAISIGASYLFHRYHHHRLERWTSAVHIGAATSGAVRNYCLKTNHSSPAP